jgi:hypothetical protein
LCGLNARGGLGAGGLRETELDEDEKATRQDEA